MDICVCHRPLGATISCKYLYSCAASQAGLLQGDGGGTEITSSNRPSKSLRLCGKFSPLTSSSEKVIKVFIQLKVAVSQKVKNNKDNSML